MISRTYRMVAALTACLFVAGCTSSGPSGSSSQSSQGAPQASLTPSALTFASQAEGSTSASQMLTLSNAGTAVLAVSSIAATGDFVETNTCGSSVAAGGSCTIGVTFQPTVMGARTGRLTVTDNISDSPQSVALSGQGLASASNGGCAETGTSNFRDVFRWDRLRIWWRLPRKPRPHRAFMHWPPRPRAAQAAAFKPHLPHRRRRLPPCSTAAIPTRSRP